MKAYPYENAPSKEVGIALWFLERNEWCWRKISEFGYLQRSKLAAKTVALIAHDRVLTGELVSRGLPTYYDARA